MKTKKEIGKRRYDRRMSREKAQNANVTRPSDLSTPRIGDGIPANHKARAHDIKLIFQKMALEKKHRHPIGDQPPGCVHDDELAQLPTIPKPTPEELFFPLGRDK